MSKIESLSILLDPEGKDFLAELSGKVIANVQKSTISGALKNAELSGDPSSGTVEARRFANANSAAYGSARTAGKGTQVKAKTVTVAIDTDREIVEELEQKDISLYGVDGVLERRSANHVGTMVRELERSFFTEAITAGTAISTSETLFQKKIEAAIQQMETTKNDYIDGYDRALMSVVCTPAVYGAIRDYLDTGVGNANVNTAAEGFGTYHGVRVYSSVYLPAKTEFIVLGNGAIAQPVMPKPYTAEKIPLSEAYAVSLFFYYGTKAVTPELILKSVVASA
ncbi:hypothetical protein LI291_10735 [Intestinibacillus massiliensis]|nr:hypothetical protein [Intestinibacillus massiliensis]